MKVLARIIYYLSPLERIRIERINKTFLEAAAKVALEIFFVVKECVSILDLILCFRRGQWIRHCHLLVM